MSVPALRPERPAMRINLAPKRTFRGWGSARREVACACAACFYCGAPLSSRHEHDHYPVPQRHGGDRTVPACLNCHDLKDRLPLREWPAAAKKQAMEEFMAAVPFGPARILWAKVVMLALDETRAPRDQDAE
jgi:hypothetical protein